MGVPDVPSCNYGTIEVPEELEADGEKQIIPRCNACASVMGTLNVASAKALVMKFLDEVVIHRFR
jgi:hypothetical protein